MDVITGSAQAALELSRFSFVKIARAASQCAGTAPSSVPAGTHEA